MAVSLAVVMSLAGCSGSGGDGVVPEFDASDPFVVQAVSPPDNGTAFLNDVIAIDFSLPVDLDTVNLDAVAFQAFDQEGDPVTEPVTGVFRLARRPGDSLIGRRLVFEPRLPTNRTFDNGGLRPGHEYLVQLVGGDRHNGTAVRSSSGKPLEAVLSFRFRMVEGTTASQLFRNPGAGGPRRTDPGITIAGREDVVDVGLNLLGSPPQEVRLFFDQALNPVPENLPVALDTDPEVRRIADRGRIYLEYDDPERGDSTWIPADVEIERNDSQGATLLLRPVGVLPNNAEIRVIVLSTVEDISGESNVGEPNHDPVFAKFHTAPAFGQQWNGVVEEFASSAAIDFDAVFPEPLAEVGPGYVRAAFDFEGSETAVDYHPLVSEVVLDTGYTQVVPEIGLPFNVSGGVFRFRNVTIPQGVTVQGRGPNPMVWLCSGEMRVDGTLSVRGGDGERVNTLNSATFAKGGGVGVCGGGNGGNGSPNSIARSTVGGTGNGPLQVPGRGGRGGLMSCIAGCALGNGGGSGGGGGSLATQGDPWYRAPALPGTGFRQREGDGGMGCSNAPNQPVPARSAVLIGGDAADAVFIDSRSDNDFYGFGIDRNRNVRIRGELTVPMGGGGGGGGGDSSSNQSCLNDPSFKSDESGGGGGGGGGVLIVKALGKIEVSATGRIVADGGHGGGGAWAGSCGWGGGGGAGAGGMVVLMSSSQIVLHVHGSGSRWNYADNDYDFCVSADGGVCTTGSYAGTGGAWLIESKYPPQGQPVYTGVQYDRNPLGGFGGMGIVQLMAPVGEHNADGTNTLLDDNIVVMRNGFVQTGAEKQAALAWRGIRDDQGVARDDFGGIVEIGNDGGDVRPAPHLLPVPFGDTSRVRSKWLDTGASQRRELASPDGLPRGIVTAAGAVAGPMFEFAGTFDAGSSAGFVRHLSVSRTAAIAAPEVVARTPVLALTDGVTHDGQAAYAVDLAADALTPGPLGAERDRYRHYEAQLLGAAQEQVASLRILGHTDRRLYVAADAVMPSGVESVRVLAKFFRITTSGSEGLGPLAEGLDDPVANVRIGFAFHQDPSSEAATRYPPTSGDFVHSLADPGLLDWIGEHGPPRYVKWDVLFDIAYPQGEGFGPQSPLPRLDFLRLPFRF
ncbi:MAG: Ig-like domain-containing protein [bacterium]|nr:Ig-like domain-containing protein [bacterium]